uniref:Uncharacterized protein n=1 Tax=Aegilops tauschii subsp. strangulata TaxID=200361 RepID=A0A453HQY6_AEGTS
MMAVRYIFFEGRSSLHLLNQAFLVLLPKKDSPLDLANFGPISLVHSFPKLLQSAHHSPFPPGKHCAQLPQASCKGARLSRFLPDKRCAQLAQASRKGEP